MDVETICGIICMFVFVLGMLALLFIAVLSTYKSEKEFRELRNKELKARIKLFEKYINK